MSCGCPVLSTDSDGVRSFITHNRTGKFYPIGNVNAAVSEAVDLMHNIQLRIIYAFRADSIWPFPSHLTDTPFHSVK
ncbi:hypothetical protein [Paenibacillus sp. 1A_MP2]|uniref:hypothetical protein n=1 Tax=Paenibacillus sp. 1A_MP2 TaxID=3457495 RepID=UPI003FCDC900